MKKTKSDNETKRHVMIKNEEQGGTTPYIFW